MPNLSCPCCCPFTYLFNSLRKNLRKNSLSTFLRSDVLWCSRHKWVTLHYVPEETIKKGGCMGGGRHCQKWVKTIGSGKCLTQVFNFNSIGYVFYRVQRVQCFFSWEYNKLGVFKIISKCIHSLGGNVLNIKEFLILSLHFKHNNASSFSVFTKDWNRAI